MKKEKYNLFRKTWNSKTWSFISSGFNLKRGWNYDYDVSDLTMEQVGSIIEKCGNEGGIIEIQPKKS
jgi:hypothetical protein